MGADELPVRSPDSDIELSSLTAQGKEAGGKRYRVTFPDYGDEHGIKGLLKDPLIGDTKEWIANRRRKTTEAVHSYTWLDWLAIFLPCTTWMRQYQRRWILNDLAAGISVAALVIPQGMSYAKLAGLPNQYGLYGAFVPVIIYATLGSSRHLAVGPVAVTSLLLGTGLKNVVGKEVAIQADPNNPTSAKDQDIYNHAAVQVAFLAGLLYTAVGFLQLGWVTNFLSQSVIAGFMTGASVIIGLQQTKFFFGYNTYSYVQNKKTITVNFPRQDGIQLQLGTIFNHNWIATFKWREFIMGGTFLVILLLFKTLGKRVKKLFFLRAIGPLFVAVLGIAIVNIFHLECNTTKSATNKDPLCFHHIRVVGKIPKGLPHETATWWFPMPQFGQKLGYAVVICLIDLLESLSIAKALAAKNHYQLNFGQELRGLGIANLAGAMFNTYTTTGSFSRSAVMDQCGAKTQLAAYIQAILVGITLLCLTPVFKNMPQNAQGAIIVSAIIGLFNYSEWIFLWKVNKLDWIVFNAAWLGVMFAGVEIGLAIAIGTSILLVLYKTGFPHMAVLGRLPQTTVYRNVKQYPEAKQLEGILIVRVDAPIYFANVTPLRDALLKYELRLEKALEARGKRLEFIIMDLSPVTDIDASAVHFLQDWITQHQKRGVQPVFANPSRLVVRLLERSGIPKMVGEEFISVRVHDAVQYCQELMMERGRNALVLPDLEKGKVPLSKASPPASFSDAADDVQGANLAQTESEIKRREPHMGPGID